MSDLNPLSRESSTRDSRAGIVRDAQTTNPKADIYTRVTNAIVAAIEVGAGNYRMPWVVRQDKGFSPISISTVKPYRGINTRSLGAIAVEWLQFGTLGDLSAMASPRRAGSQG